MKSNSNELTITGTKYHYQIIGGKTGMKDNSHDLSHVCNTDNQYYKYAQKKGYPLIAVIPKGHCIWCGDVRHE